jgi:2-polyprenyl-3-methyl-5-hydroxy-6-metoxy-1,4-benzoquinol methylase
MLKKIYLFIKKDKVLNIIIFSDLMKKIFQLFEKFIFGSRMRRNFINKILDFQFKSKYRHDWLFSIEPPHYDDFERYENLFTNPYDYYSLQRGYFTSEIINKGDKLLDIGTGSGFFAKRFFSSKCKTIDAIDNDKNAINYANKFNSEKNINYILEDAVKNPFPSKDYDIIVWDGAIGHFFPETTDKMLKKISECLNQNGIFVGSESLGRLEGVDHFQFWDNLLELRNTLKKNFKYVYLKELDYPIGPYQDFVRREAYWRCCNSEDANNRLIKNWN